MPFGQHIPAPTRHRGWGGGPREQDITLPFRNLHSSEKHLEFNFSVVCQKKKKRQGEGREAGSFKDWETQQYPQPDLF